MKRSGRKTIRVLAGAYAAALAAVSLLPSGAETFGGWDRRIAPTVQNAVHVPAYALLVILAVSALSPAGAFRGRTLAWVAIACCLFGLVLEIAQAAIPGRVFSWVDGLLNLLGVAVGAVAATLWRRGVRRRLAPDGAGGTGSEAPCDARPMP